MDNYNHIPRTAAARLGVAQRLCRFQAAAANTHTTARDLFLQASLAVGGQIAITLLLEFLRYILDIGALHIEK